MLGFSLTGMTVIVGGIPLFATEIPEKFGPIGGHRKVAVHEFPGGKRTIQTFGSFPEAIAWSGLLQGPLSMFRAMQLDRLRVASEIVTLSYAAFAWTGYVVAFHASPATQFRIPYSMVFEPLQDQAGGSTPPTGGISPEASMLDQTTALQGFQGGVPMSTPTSMFGSVGGLLTTVGVGMLAANGIVSSISASHAANIHTSVNRVIATGTPLINKESAEASPALDIMGRARAVGAILKSTTAPRQRIQVINPSLPAMAAQYLGDGKRWREIAEINNIKDPQPVGEFTLLIPEK